MEPPLTPAAFRALYEAEFAYVERTLRRLGVAPADLEDLAHELFVVVYQQYARYDRMLRLRAWLFGIAFRLASNYRQRAQRREVAMPTPEVPDPAHLPEATLEASQTRARVLAVLDTLDLEQRAVLVLHDLEERPAPEVAATLQIPLNTVYSRLRAARQRVAATLRRWRATRGEL